MNGIILNDKVFEAVAANKNLCQDCDLIAVCTADSYMNNVCENFRQVLDENISFRYSQSLTDKLNGK